MAKVGFVNQPQQLRFLGVEFVYLRVLLLKAVLYVVPLVVANLSHLNLPPNLSDKVIFQRVSDSAPAQFHFLTGILPRW